MLQLLVASTAPSLGKPNVIKCALVKGVKEQTKKLSVFIEWLCDRKKPFDGPKDENTNRLLYLQEFPWFANESCETVRDLMPVVDCEDSVCIKAVIKQPPAERTICETGGAIVRDCWSRVFSDAVKNPRARRDVVRLAQTSDSEETIGIIYTCEGFLCNSSAVSRFSMLFLPMLLLLIRRN
ncbi:hypothetical protein CAEBREN_06501 [Caenorhabditis brenneri]|uniref:Uncharacterized protein n=1 Tax=Caenorhabditis brenneri TaxID=135651 RepID=G0NND4_CAEBE|nr:hypothetical protein CAEBREN_06501 [Caenorhabditis brenneri]